MSEFGAGEREIDSSAANSAFLRVAAGTLAGPLLTRVVGMMLARAECPVDRLDDAMLICDALGAHACAQSADGHIEFTVHTRSGSMELRVGALAAGGAQRLIQTTSLPGVGAVLEPIADQVRVEKSVTGPGEELVLDLGFGRRASQASPNGNRSAGGEPAAGGPADQSLPD